MPSVIPSEAKDPIQPCATCGPSGSSHNGFTPTAFRSIGNVQDDSPQLDLTAVRKEIDAFEAAGTKLNESIKAKLASRKVDPQLADTINHGLMQVERNWLNLDGIPGRPWFKHILYGARFTYAHLELPGLTEAMEKQDWPTAKQQAEILRQALANNTKLLDGLNSSLKEETADSVK